MGTVGKVRGGRAEQIIRHPSTPQVHIKMRMQRGTFIGFENRHRFVRSFHEEGTDPPHLRGYRSGLLKQ